MTGLPWVIFAIKLDKRYFGKRPKSGDTTASLLHAFLPFSKTTDEEELINFYGEGTFAPLDVVKMQCWPGYLDLADSLFPYPASEASELEPGQIIEFSDTGEQIVIFGYELPADWEERRIRVVKTSTLRLNFVSLLDEPPSLLPMRPMGVKVYDPVAGLL